MRTLLIPVLAAVLIAGAGAPVAAQTPVPGEVILVGGDMPSQIFGPGGGHGECFDLGPGILRVSTWSPPGRTGETASLQITNTADTSPFGQYMDLTITPNQMVAEYKIERGRYCYDVAVTHLLSNPLDATEPNRADRPYKQVMLTIAFRPDR